jgi:hypothetical protein
VIPAPPPDEPPGGEEPPEEEQENFEPSQPQQKRRRYVPQPQEAEEEPAPESEEQPAEEETAQDEQAAPESSGPEEEQEEGEGSGQAGEAQEKGEGGEEQEGQSGEAEPQPEPLRVSSAKARLASSPAVSGARPQKAALNAPAGRKTQEEIEEEKRIASKAALLSQMAKGKEIAGEAELPAEEETDELEVPKPPPEDAEPAPQKYEEAKEGFRAKMQQEGIREKTRQDADAMLEAYAKENLVWLYEIYSMGGMPREDFLQRVKEKMAEAGVAQPQQAPEAPANPALANLGREIDKRYKK